MGTLTAKIRQLTGAAVGDASDPEIADALARNRMWHGDIELVWHEQIAAGGVRTYTRARFASWGEFEPATEEAPAGTTIVSSAGVAAEDWTLSADGWVTFATDQDAAAYFASSYSYDVNAAAAEIADKMVGTIARDYTVKLGDQTFDRSKAVEQMERLAQSLRAKALPRRSRMARADELASPPRRRRGITR